jgi:hypothetical protein
LSDEPENLVNIVYYCVSIQFPKLRGKQLKKKVTDSLYSGFLDSLFSRAIIEATSIAVNQALSEDEILTKSQTLLVNMPLCVLFHMWICHKVINDNINMRSKSSVEKRWNWTWDYNVLFPISNKINGRDIILVTSDKDVKTFLNDFGYNNRVLQLAEYLNYIEYI